MALICKEGIGLSIIVLKREHMKQILHRLRRDQNYFKIWKGNKRKVSNTTLILVSQKSRIYQNNKSFRLNNSIMTLVNEASDYASPFKRGSRRATTIINSP